MEREQIEQNAVVVSDEAGSLVIKTDEGLQTAGLMLTGIKRLRREIDGSYDPIIKKAHEAHREAIEQKKKVNAPLVKAEGIIKPKIALYTDEQERIQKQEEARVRKEQEEAEKKRKEDEDKRIQEAADLEEAGKPEEADAILDEPEPETASAPIVLPPKPAKAEGVSVKKVWKFRIKDESQIPRNFLMVDEKKIGQLVRAMKDEAVVPGVEVYSESQVSARSL